MLILSRGARGVYGWLRGEEGLERPVVVVVVVVESFGGRVQDGRVCLSYA